MQGQEACRQAILGLAAQVRLGARLAGLAGSPAGAHREGITLYAPLRVSSGAASLTGSGKVWAPDAAGVACRDWSGAARMEASIVTASCHAAWETDLAGGTCHQSGAASKASRDLSDSR